MWCQAQGSQKAKPQSVWETGQAQARINQEGSPVSLLSQRKQPSTIDNGKAGPARLWRYETQAQAPERHLWLRTARHS